MKTFKEFINEGKKITIDVDYVCDEPKECEKIAKKHKVTIKSTGDSTADITGEKENLIAWLKDSGYTDLEDIYPELF
jgi:hypothetical protein